MEEFSNSDGHSCMERSQEWIIETLIFLLCDVFNEMKDQKLKALWSLLNMFLLPSEER